MPSAPLDRWSNDRLPRLAEVDAQCSTARAALPASPHLGEENLRGFILLLSAHFQGFCRDLHSECAQIITSKVRPALQFLIQQQFSKRSALGRGNPNIENIKADFERFDLSLNLARSDPANHARLADLKQMNEWRNIAAHHGTVPPGGLPTLAAVRAWRDSCDGLATSLDRIMYDQLRKILRRRPWDP